MIVGFVGMMIPATAVRENCHALEETTKELDALLIKMPVPRGRSSTTDQGQTQEQFDAIPEVGRDRFNQSAGPTGRHSGAACVVSGLPAESSTCI